METAHASTTRAPTARELDAKMAAVDDFEINMKTELTGNHLIALRRRYAMLYDLRDDCLYGAYGRLGPYAA